MRRPPIAAALVVGLTACAGPGAEAPPSSAPPATSATSAVSTPASASVPAAPATPSPSPAVPSCATLAAALPPSDQVGQLFMLSVPTSGLDEATADVLTDLRVGSVVLLGQSEAGAERVGALTAEVRAAAGDGPPILIAVDQEGGTVQRLRGPGFSDIPPAVEQGELATEELVDRAATWGRELRSAGIDYNLAPVADVVPRELANRNAPIGALRRNFGNDVTTVSRAVTDVVTGMREAGVATSLKHFPGLGKVRNNTDFDVAHDTIVTSTDPDLAAFSAGIAAGAESVMISSAVYERIDPDAQAVFSQKVIGGMLRDGLGFDGVVISDDLGAAASVSHIEPGERAVRFLAAGGDLVINAEPGSMTEMVAAVSARRDEDPAMAAGITASAARVLALKASVGLVDCTPE